MVQNLFNMLFGALDTVGWVSIIFGGVMLATGMDDLGGQQTKRGILAIAGGILMIGIKAAVQGNIDLGWASGVGIIPFI